MEEHLATSADGRRRLQAASERQAIGAPSAIEAEDDEQLGPAPPPASQSQQETHPPPVIPCNAPENVDMDIDLMEPDEIPILAFLSASP